MELSLSRVHFPITALGPGRRLGIWFQGYNIHCLGCTSANIWGPGQRRIILARLLADIQPWLEQAEGITISGGEPFEQFTTLLALLDELRQHSRANILVYSDYPLGHLHTQLEQAAGLIDTLINDPYQQHTEQSLTLCGSDNQRLSLLIDLNRSRLGGYQRPLRKDDKALNLMFGHSGGVWMASIPRRDDLLRLQDLLHEQSRQLSVSAHRPR